MGRLSPGGWQHHNFIEKALGLVMGGKRMMSDLMDKGLAKMKFVLELGKNG